MGNPDDGVTRGSVYDWSTRRWVKVDLSSSIAGLPHPDRFLSPQGKVLVRVFAVGEDLTIADPVHDVQLSGVGSVS